MWWGMTYMGDEVETAFIDRFFFVFCFFFVFFQNLIMQWRRGLDQWLDMGVGICVCIYVCYM